MPERSDFDATATTSSTPAAWEITERPIALVGSGADDQWALRRELKFLFGNMPVISFIDGGGLFGYLHGHPDKAQKPWLILLDMDADGMDSLTTLELIKARAGDADIPVLVISSDGDQESVDRVLEKGADGIMQKPLRRGNFIEFLNGRESRPLRDSLN